MEFDKKSRGKKMGVKLIKMVGGWLDKTHLSPDRIKCEAVEANQIRVI